MFKKLPFHLMPGSWGLKGRTRDIAQAEYELTGYELEKRLLEIKKPDFGDAEQEYMLANLKIDLKYKKLTEQEYHSKLIELIEDPTQQQLARLELDLRHGKITQNEYDKGVATAKGEPWVTVLDMNFGGKNPLEGSFELDWNEFFVEKLIKEGYVGQSPDAVVNLWFMEVCRNIAMEEFEGTGNFAADSEANLEAYKRFNQTTLDGGKKVYK